MTPKRPEATCLIALRFESPLAIGRKRSASSPPSPVFDLPPSRFMAIASVSCASPLIEPYDIAPVAKRLTIVSTGSTSSIGTGGRPASGGTARAASRGAAFCSSTALRVLLEDRVLAGARRVLQLEHRLRVEEVVLAVAAPLVLAARLELLRPRRLAAERAVVPQAHFLRDHVDADAADARRRVREVRSMNAWLRPMASKICAPQ